MYSMLKTYLPFILLFFAILLCVGVLWLMGNNRYVYFLKSIGLSEPTLVSPLGSASTKVSPIPTPLIMSQSFSDYQMNIKFSYPENLQVEKKSSTLLWIHTTKNTDEKGSMLVYVDKVAKATATTDVTVPFKINGDISQNMVIKKDGYNARLVTFKSGVVNTQVFFFRSNEQVVIARLPEDNFLDPDVAYAVLQSIQKIK